MRVRFASALIAIAVLAACAPPRIDGRDSEHTRSSIARVRRSLPEARQKEFDSALRYLMAAAATLPTLANPQVRSAIAGKSGEEIITAAEQQRASEKREREEEALRREKQAIDATLASIHQNDRDAAARRGAVAPEGPHLSPTDLAALVASPNAPVGSYIDDDVRSRCEKLAGGHSDILNSCLQTEMEGKRAVTGALPTGVSAELGQRIRDNCARKCADSYRDRQACENTDRDSIVNVSAHPEVLKALNPQRQLELRTLMGQ